MRPPALSETRRALSIVFALALMAAGPALSQTMDVAQGGGVGPATTEAIEPPGTPVAPGWYLLARLPEGVSPWQRMDGLGDMLLVAEWGGVRQLTATGWVAVGPEDAPRLSLGDERRSVIRDVFVRSSTEAYGFGTRQTIMRWDGERWRVEHQDRKTGQRSRFEIYACEDRIYATDRWSTKRREADGTWTSLGRVARPCAEPDTVPSPEKCWRHSHSPYRRVVWCRDGLNIWDAAARSWTPHPATGAEARMPEEHFEDQAERVLRWQHGSTLLVAVGPRVYEKDGDGWALVFESPGPDIDVIRGRAEPFIVVGRDVWRR